jgi:hypothetical protein
MASSFYSGILDAAKTGATSAGTSVLDAATKSGGDFVTSKVGSALNLPTVSPTAAQTFNQPPNQTSGPSPVDAKAEVFGATSNPNISENKYVYYALAAVAVIAIAYVLTKGK